MDILTLTSKKSSGGGGPLAPPLILKSPRGKNDHLGRLAVWEQNGVVDRSLLI